MGLFSPESFQQKNVIGTYHISVASFDGLVMRSTVSEQLQQSLFGELVWAIAAWFPIKILLKVGWSSLFYMEF